MAFNRTEPPRSSSNTGERLQDAIASTLSVVSAITIAGTAFLYLAGETFLDRYQRSFGILFGATETTTAHVISQGYTVVFFALIESVPNYAKFLAIVVFIGIGIGLSLGFGSKMKWPGFSKAVSMTEALNARCPNLSRNLLLFALAILVLCGAQPAGKFAAKREREFTLQEVKKGANFIYSGSGKAVRGFPIAQDHNRIWLLNSDGLVALPVENLTIRPLPIASEVRR